MTDAEFKLNNTGMRGVAWVLLVFSIVIVRVKTNSLAWTVVAFTVAVLLRYAPTLCSLDRMEEIPKEGQRRVGTMKGRN